MDTIVGSCFGNKIELLPVLKLFVSVEAIPVNASILRRNAERRRGLGNGSDDRIVLPIAFALDLVIGGSIGLIACFFNGEYDRFSAGYRGGGRKSNSESQSDKKLCREFSSSDVMLQLEFQVILYHNLERKKKVLQQ